LSSIEFKLNSRGEDFENKRYREKNNATYNTIKRFIESDPEYHKKVDNVLHVTDLGIDKLEEKYGIKGEILTDDNIHFYKIRLYF